MGCKSDQRTAQILNFRATNGRKEKGSQWPTQTSMTGFCPHRDATAKSERSRSKIERLAECGWKPHRDCLAQRSLSRASIYWCMLETQRGKISSNSRLQTVLPASAKTHSFVRENMAIVQTNSLTYEDPSGQTSWGVACMSGELTHRKQDPD